MSRVICVFQDHKSAFHLITTPPSPQDSIVEKVFWARSLIWKKTFFIRLFEVSRVVKFIETECRMMVTRPWGKGKVGSYCLMGTEFLFFKMKRVLEMDGGDGSTIM